MHAIRSVNKFVCILCSRLPMRASQYSEVSDEPHDCQVWEARSENLYQAGRCHGASEQTPRAVRGTTLQREAVCMARLALVEVGAARRAGRAAAAGWARVGWRAVRRKAGGVAVVLRSDVAWHTAAGNEGDAGGVVACVRHDQIQRAGR